LGAGDNGVKAELISITFKGKRPIYDERKQLDRNKAILNDQCIL
jgi:hypothetical protein